MLYIIAFKVHIICDAKLSVYGSTPFAWISIDSPVRFHWEFCVYGAIDPNFARYTFAIKTSGTMLMTAFALFGVCVT